MEESMLEALYKATTNIPSLIMVPSFKYLMVDGSGRPEELAFQEAAQTVYTIAYLVKFSLPLEQREKVSPMEVRWFLDRESRSFRWTMMIRQPEFITGEQIEAAVKEALIKKKPCFPERLRFEKFSEGYCAQILHKGAYSEMNTTLIRMTDYLQSMGMEYEQDTHDIYLNDSRKTRPENLRTIMRVRILNAG